MAEPQANQATQAEQTRAKGNAALSQTAETRTFEEGRKALAQAAQPMIEGGRHIAEQSRRTGLQMADAWRQAWDPFMAMQLDLSQWFDDAVRQTFGFRATPMMHPLGRFSPASPFGLPAADLKETDGAHLLSIELPGLRREDVDVSIVDDSLVVCANKAEETDGAAASYRVSERRYGRFERAFPLPADVDRKGVQAQFRDGVLRLTLPKQAPTATQRAKIEVKA
jgi:HSP20 family protein